MIHVGTSGFQYEEWRGSFYPSTLSKPKMLGYYAGHFSTTEINYTFRHLPSVATLERWSVATPEHFVFAFKAPQQITHFSKLRDCEKHLEAFAAALEPMGPKTGPVLFQLPPTFKKDAAVLRDFLEVIPKALQPAFEFRHASWFDDETFALLKSSHAALCIADDEKLSTPAISTAKFSYFRLRRLDYTDADLRRWAKILRVQATPRKPAYVYFKHEETAAGVKFAQHMMTLVA